MDANSIKLLKPRLKTFLKSFRAGMKRTANARHLYTYVTGQLSNLPRKSIEPMALAAGVPPRTLQEFLSLLDWDEQKVLRRLQTRVARDHAGEWSVGVIDDTGYPKKGTKTPGVARQWCGRLGKVDNCVVTVHLGYLTPDFHCLLDGELYLPKPWADDRTRCRAAGIPEDKILQTKWQIALDLIDRAKTHGLHFDWMTFDEGYGQTPEFLFELDDQGQPYVGEVPGSFAGTLVKPTGSAWHPKYLRNLLAHSAVFSRRPWKTYHIKDTDKGPVVWKAKSTFLYLKRGPQILIRHLILAQNTRDLQAHKYFVSNAPLDTPVETLLAVGFARAGVERCLQEEKSELGLSHFEVRNYRSLKRHLILTQLSELFLAETRHGTWGKKGLLDRLPSPHRRGGPDPIGLDDRPQETRLPRPHGPRPDRHAETQPRRGAVPS